MNRNIKFTIPQRDDHHSEDAAESVPLREPTRRKPRSALGGTAGVRLGLLCLLLVMVLMAMNHASKPQSWNWLFQFDQVDLPNNTTGVPVDTPPPSQTTKTPETASGSSQPVTAASRDRALAENLERQFWRNLLKQLDGQQQVRLFNLIEAATAQTDLPLGSTAAVRPVVNRIMVFHKKFVEQESDHPEKLKAFQKVWSESWLPAIEAVIANRPNVDLINDEVRQLKPLLNQTAETLIQDKTPIERGREAYAWFAAWSQIFDQPLSQDNAVSATVTQLIAQPDAWRGENIRINGTAMRVERVEASYNAIGIENYYVVWIKPDHPSIYPFCVYTLVAPESLMGEPDETMREVRQPVTTTARFFKNRLFNASQKKGNEAAFAPVLLTAMVEAVADPNASTSTKTSLPSASTIIFSITLISVVALLIAFYVYRTTLTTARSLPRKNSLEKGFQILQEDGRVETTSEKLQRLSDKMGDPPSDSSDQA